MLNRFFFGLLMAIILLCSVTPSHALWWMVYHKPEFKGKVIDAETKEPIDGAVVVVTYSNHIFRFMPESGSFIFDVREALTDKEGDFYIPSYTTVIDPLAWEEWARFIIFKPGYGSFPNYHVSPPKLGVNPEEFFSKGRIGEEGEIVWLSQKIKVTFGVVELPKLKTREERIKALPGPVGEFSDRKKQKQFIRLLNEENKNLGFSGEYTIE